MTNPGPTRLESVLVDPVEKRFGNRMIKKTKKKMTNPDLPLDIMLEIFSRLPAKSVDRCRCLSKTWNTHLSSTSFINLHFARTKSRQHICLSFTVFSSGDPLQCFIKSIYLPKLFSCKHHDQIESISEDVLTWTEPVAGYSGTSMVVATDGSLYVAASNKCQRATEPEESLKLFKFCLANHQFQQADDFCPSKLSTCKFNPTVVEIKQRIYVLSCSPYLLIQRVSDNPLEVYDITPFEVYDLTHHVWKTLEPPPFMSPSFGLYSTGTILSYIVIGKYLCVSTRYMSFAFDTESEKWERCDLFSTFYAKNHCLDYTSWFHYEDYLNDLAQYRKFVGVPFPYRVTALEYDGYLLSVMEPYVKALKIVDGKVEEPEILLKLNIRSFERSFLVDLGGGEFCLVAVDKNVFDFIKFKVVKKSSDGGLTCAEADVEVSTVHNDKGLKVSCSRVVAR